MASFNIFVDKKKGNNNDPFNDKTAYRIRTDEEANYVTDKIETDYESSISQMRNVAETFDKLAQIIYDQTGQSIQSPVHDFIRETDEKYYHPYIFKKNIYFQENDFRVYNEKNKAPKQEGFSGNFFTGHLTDDNPNKVFGSKHLRERIEWVQKNQINKIVNENPEKFENIDLSLLNFETYENKNKEELKYLKKEQKIISEYNEGNTLGFIEPGDWGVITGMVKDPALWSTLPLSFMTGGNSLALNAIIKMSLWEGVIAGLTEGAIQANVVEYNKHLDGEYGWEEAKQAIAFASVGGAVGTFALANIFKGVKNVYVKSLNKSSSNKIKNISNKVNSIIKEKGETEDSLKEIMDFVNSESDKLSTIEKKQLLNLIPGNLKKPLTKTTEKILEGDEIVDTTNPMESSIPSQKEHNERIKQAGNDLLSNRNNSLDDETINPLNLEKNFDEGNILREQRLDPNEINVDAETFQFKSVDYDPKSGVSSKLKDVDVWDQDSAETVIVYQDKNGKNFIADGHQRLALAKKIQAEGKQKPYLLANIYREVDNYTQAQVMIKAMIKNVRTGTASATDVAKILRQPGDFIENVTNSISSKSTLWRNAVELSKLSDEAFGYFLNNGINDDIAALVGNLVKDKDLHIQVMDFLNKGDFKQGRQMEFAVRDLLSQGVGERQVEDLFGTQTIKELLFNERASVLDAALKEINKDKRLSKYLINNEGDIISKGKNKLDTATNKKIGKESEILYEYVRKNAYRKGEISNELTKAAKLYKAGDKQEAIRSFKEVISERIKQGDISRDSGIGIERNSFLEGYSQDKKKQPKQTEQIKDLEDSSNPLNGDLQYNKEYSSIQEGIENPKIFGGIEDNYKLMTKVDEDGSLVLETMSDVKKELELEREAIDFLKDCKGLK